METGDARSKIFAQCCSRGTQDVAAFPSNRGYHRSLSLYFQGSLGTSAGKTLLGQISSRNINDNLSTALQFSSFDLHKECFFPLCCSFNSSEHKSCSPTELLTANFLTIAGIFDKLDHHEYERTVETTRGGKPCSVARQKLRVKTVGVVNIEHGSRGREGSGKTDERFILSGENKREKGNRGGKKKRARGRGMVVPHPFSGRRVFTLSGG